MVLQLKIGGDIPRAFSDYNIEGATLTIQIDGEMTLTLDCVGRLNQPYIIAPFQECKLVVDGTIRFVGYLDEAPRSSNGTQDRINYKLNGPMRWLKRIMYSQDRAGLVMLAGSSGNAQTAVQTLPTALFNLLTEGPITQHILYGNAFFPQFHQIPVRPRSDVSLYDALKTLLAFNPAAYVEWGYVNFFNGLPVLSLYESDYQAANISKYFDLKTMQIIEANINPRYDLLTDQILIFYMRDNAVASVDASQIQTDATILGANKTDTLTFDTSSVLNVPTVGLADAIAKFRGKLHVDGEAIHNGIDFDDYVGDTWGFKGAQFAAFENLSATIQTIERDLFTETTRLSFGVPAAAGIYEVFNKSDFDRASVSPLQTPAFSGNTSTTPFSPTGGPGGGGIDPEGSITFTTPNGFSTVTIDGGSMTATCQSGFNTDIQCGQVIIGGPDGTCSIDADLLEGREVSFREITNCDGQKAMVLMSEFYDP